MAILTNQSDFVRADSGTWQQQMKWAIRDEGELRQRLDLPAKSGSKTPIEAVQQFPVFVPLPFLSRIQPRELNDPLLLQVLPVPAEDDDTIGYSNDPLGEDSATKSPGLLQKYNGRVLLVTTGACAINCRYCFRRHFPYEDSPKSTSQWQTAIEQIANDASIGEVILSGGDPLTLVDESFSRLVDQISSIEHVTRLRIHTRLPIMIPQRVTDQLLETLTRTRLNVVFVIHSNHAHELDTQVESALTAIKQTGATMLNQSVLLKGINDNANTLIDLSERLVECGVLPYYLHKNDPIAGTAHFEVSAERGCELISKMRSELPGYCVPRFVQELAGEPNKTVLA